VACSTALRVLSVTTLKRQMDYEFFSTQFIQKERGRGVNVHTRKSNSLGRLIKQLKTDFKKAGNTPHYVAYTLMSL
jgi:hypothetical protein